MTSNLNQQNKFPYSLNFHFFLAFPKLNFHHTKKFQFSFVLSTTQPSTKQIKQLIFRGRSIFIYIYTFIKPGQYLRFLNNFTRYFCCFTSFSDTASQKKILDLKTITERNRNHLTPTSLDFFLKKPFYLEKCRNKLKNSCFAFSLAKQPQKELNNSSL